MPLPQVSPTTTLIEFQRQLRQTCPWVDGKFLDCTFTVADGTTKTFDHGLGRAWRGAWLTANTAAGTVAPSWGAPFGPNAILDGLFVTLDVPADVTFRFWIF